MLLGILMLFGKLCFCQAIDSVREVRKSFEGTWYCKGEKRYIRISFEEDVNYATVNEWMRRNNTQSGDDNVDAYKLFIAGSKLIFPADSTEHLGSYCEFKIENNKLVQTCNGALNVTDQFLKKDKYLRTSVFIRKR